MPPPAADPSDVVSSSVFLRTAITYAIAKQREQAVPDLESFARIEPLLGVLKERPALGALRTILSLYDGVLQPSHRLKRTVSQDAEEESRLHNETLRRIARHLKERIASYEAFYSVAKKNIRTNELSSHIQVQLTTLEEAIKSVKTLSTSPSNPDEVHDTLRKVSAAAHALVFLQQDQISALEMRVRELEKNELELKQKLDPERTVKLVQRLRNLWRDHHITYKNTRGSRSSASDWLRATLVRPDRFTEEEVQLIPTAAYRQLDQCLYKALIAARYNGAAQRTGALHIPTTRQAVSAH